MDWIEQAARLGVAILASGAIGLEREIRDKTAGLRTHVLVALGSATFILISEQGISALLEAGTVNQLDRMRTLAGLIGGIGFLGAGAIIRGRVGVHGLTTAASLWTVAALGAAAGFGYYATVLIAAVCALIVLVPMQAIENWIRPPGKKTPRLDAAPSTETGFDPAPAPRNPMV